MVEKLKHLFLLFVFLISYVSIASSVNAAGAASLYLSPSTGKHNIGDTFSISVYISSPDVSINAVSSVLSFPKDQVEVVSISKDDTIVSFWVQQPSFSNAIGTISFEGVILNPGFAGETGKIMTATLKVISAGSGVVSFTSASTLANDGLGTNVLKGLRNVSFVFGNLDTPPATDNRIKVSPTPVSPPSVSVLSEVTTPSAPVVSSTTHPDSNLWYSQKNVRVNWEIPSGITNVRHVLSKDSNIAPVNIHSPKIDFEDMLNVEDGIWYFNIQFANAKGWGQVSSFKIQIDSQSPSSLVIDQLENFDLTNPVAKFSIRAEDNASGIDYYEVGVDEDEVIKMEHTENNVFETNYMSAGTHSLKVRVYDKAGNFTEAKKDFFIEGLFPPFFSEYPLYPAVGDTFVLKGKTAHKFRTVKISVQEGDLAVKEYEVKSDSSGIFNFTYNEKLKEASYKIWGEVVDESGIKSDPTAPIIIDLTKKNTGFNFGFSSDVYEIILVILLILITSWLHSISIKNRKIRCSILKEKLNFTQEKYDNLVSEVNMLLENSVNNFENLKKTRKLSVHEKNIMEEFNKLIEKIKSLE